MYDMYTILSTAFTPSKCIDMYVCTVFIRIKVGLIYTPGLKYTPGIAAD